MSLKAFAEIYDVGKSENVYVMGYLTSSAILSHLGYPMLREDQGSFNKVPEKLSFFSKVNQVFVRAFQAKNVFK